MTPAVHYPGVVRWSMSLQFTHVCCFTCLQRQVVACFVVCVPWYLFCGKLCLSDKMDKHFLRPKELAVDPSSPDSAKIFKFWFRTVEDFIASLEESRVEGSPPINKQRIIISCLSPDVYPYVEDSKSYEDTVTTLKTIYINKKNDVYTRHLLTSRQQSEGESVSEYLEVLKELAKDCTFSDISASQYRDEVIRDAFINGLSSPSIRQHLLEVNSLTLGKAQELASNLDKIQQQVCSMKQLSSAPVACSVSLAHLNTPINELTNSSLKSMGNPKIVIRSVSGSKHQKNMASKGRQVGIVNPELRKIEEDNLSTSSCSELQLNSFVKREETAEVGRWPPQPSPLRDDDTSPPADCPTEITTTAEEDIPGSDAASTIINQDGERCKQTTDNESIAALPFELNQPRSTAAAGIGCAAPAYNVSVSSEDWSNPELVDDDDEDDVVVIGEVRRPAHAQCGRDETTSSGTQPTTKALLQTEKRPYKCRLCNDVFNSTTDLECHLWMHTGNWPQASAPQTALRTNSPVDNVSGVASRQAVRFSGKGFSSAPDEENNNNFSAGNTFDRILSTPTHQRPQLANQSSTDSTKCPENSRSKEATVGAVKCHACDRLFRSGSDLARHMCLLGGHFSASSFGDERAAPAASSGSVQPQAGGQRPDPFSWIHKKNFTRKQYAAMCERWHANEETANSPPTRAGNSFSCLVCKKSFTKQSSLQMHLPLHSGARPFACDVCGKAFSLKGNLNKHARMHSSERSHACLICNRTFQQKGNLKAHMRVVHAGLKPFVCHLCNKTFSFKGNLKQHMRVHIKEKPCNCPICGRSFSCNAYVNRHVRAVHIRKTARAITDAGGGDWATDSIALNSARGVAEEFDETSSFLSTA